ncbi:MAG: hypothetical protein Q3M24_15990 [Candidatus Electrothrix aestuarii]|uniref:Uncharacterized protein n=1 Tax=Candidatus Electrothrix aestuarii TaxID=3062594 RepID=A0AAU8M2R8_9BACT
MDARVTGPPSKASRANVSIPSAIYLLFFIMSYCGILPHYLIDTVLTEQYLSLLIPDHIYLAKNDFTS